MKKNTPLYHIFSFIYAQSTQDTLILSFMISIFDYMDYREFLRDFYKEQKKDKPFFSYRFIGNQVDMDSSYVIKVLQGNLHIARNKIDRFITLLKLNEVESEYFETLVHFGRAKTGRERKLCFDKLFSLSTVKSERLDAHRYEFFQKSYYSTVWSLINCLPFDGDYRKLAERCTPAITVWDAKRAVKLLTLLGLIIQDDTGVYRTSGLNLTTGQKWQSGAIEHFQREMMRLASASIDTCEKQERDISTVTLCVNENNLPEIQECIRLFRSTLIKMVNGYGGTERVYQLNVQLFPISTKTGEQS